VSERDWLAHLDDRREIRAMHNRMDVVADELRDEIEAATRQGWQLIVSGIVLQAVGTLLVLIA
jgi:DNA-binding ferritin-like protein (Dps family)